MEVAWVWVYRVHSAERQEKQSNWKSKLISIDLVNQRGRSFKKKLVCNKIKVLGIFRIETKQYVQKLQQQKKEIFADIRFKILKSSGE